MKAEERKQLEQNSLTRVLGEAVEGFKTGPSRATWYGIAAVALVATLVGTWWWFSRDQERKQSELWSQLDNAASEEALKKVAEENPNSTQASVADLQRARLKLRQALKRIYTPGEYAQHAKELEEAAALFEKSASQFDKSAPLLAQEALLGAGQAYETLGKLDKAKEFYDRAVTKDDASVYAAQARAGLDRLTKQEARLKEVNKTLSQ